MTKTAIIAGAGPAGLTAAYELLKHTDIEVQVFEMTDTIGGIAQTYNYKGNKIDIGGHRFFSKSKRVVQWWLNILPLQDSDHTNLHDAIAWLCPECQPAKSTPDAVMLRRNRLSRIFYKRQFFPYPLSITFRIAKRLGIFNTVLIAASYIKARLLPIKKEDYLDAFFINRFGKRLYLTFFKDYTEKVWGLPCSSIKADWGAQRIKGLSLRRAVSQALKDLLGSGEQQQRETSLITEFYYPKFGPGQMWEEVTRQIKQCGAKVAMQQKISGLQLTDGRVTSVTVTDVQTGDSTEVACDYFFSTMPIRELIACIKPAPPTLVKDIASNLQYRDFLTVGLLLRKMNIQTKTGVVTEIKDNWIYIQEGDVMVGRIQIFNNWTPGMVADPSTVWIGLEYFLNDTDDLWNMQDEDLINFGAQEMAKIGMIIKEDVLDGCVRRMPKAYPTYAGSYESIDTVKEYIDTVDNLYLIGRNGMHRYNNQDHSMLTAMLAVEDIIGGGGGKKALWDVNAQQQYHETKTES